MTTAEHQAEPTMRFTTTSDGVRIAYTIVGDGPPCIWCCGPEGSHTQLMWSLPTIRRDNYRLSDGMRTHWFDWRGTGLSGPAPEGFSIETHVRDLEAMAEVAGAGPVALFGGFGSPMAILPFAAKHPERVSRIVLYAAGVKSYSRGPTVARAAWQKLLDEPSVAQKVLTRGLVGWQDESLSDWDRFYAGLDLEYMDRCQQQISRTDVSEYVSKVTCPVLIIQGRDLRWPTREMAVELAAAFPAGELHLIEGSSYNITGAKEDPTPHIMEFLRRDSVAHRVTGQHGGDALTSTNGHRTNGASPGMEALSAREQEVLSLIAAGRSNHEVASTLGIAVSTVNRHVVNIYAKAGVHNRAEATLWAVANGIVSATSAT